MTKKTDKPWGHELLWAKSDKYAGKEIFIKNGHQLSLQYHEKKEESVYVIKGELNLEIDGNTDSPSNVRLKPGEAYHITTGTVHRMIADNGDVTLIEVSTPELDDVVRLKDDYGRV